jgi:hypothetical protein
VELNSVEEKGCVYQADGAVRNLLAVRESIRQELMFVRPVLQDLKSHPQPVPQCSRIPICREVLNILVRWWAGRARPRGLNLPMHVLGKAPIQLVVYQLQEEVRSGKCLPTAVA